MTADPASDYARAGFDGRLEWGRVPAFLQIDICMAYLDPASPLYAPAFAPVRDSAARLLAAARAAGIPIVHMQVGYLPGGIDGGMFYRKIPALRLYQRGSAFALPPPELAPRPGEVVIVKQYSSAFFATSLAMTLTALGVDTVAIAGVSTSACVRASATDAIQHGFIPFVCRDAVGDRNAAAHEANLFDLQAKYAEVVDEGFVVERFRAAGAARRAG